MRYYIFLHPEIPPCINYFINILPYIPQMGDITKRFQTCYNPDMRNDTDIPEYYESTIILISVDSYSDGFYLNYYHDYCHKTAILRNPQSLDRGLLSGTELKVRIFDTKCGSVQRNEVELLTGDEDYPPEALLTLLMEEPPVYSVFFGLISEVSRNSGRYYMLRDHNADGLVFCSGRFKTSSGRGYCMHFDRQWVLRYNMIENFFYGISRIDSEIMDWKHPSIRLHRVDEFLTQKNLSRKFRDYAAGWNRYNFFYSDDWSLPFYRRQAELGFIAITHEEDSKVRLTPQLQREYAVLDWGNLVIEKKIKKIFRDDRIHSENIRLKISDDPAEVLSHLMEVWTETWINDQYAELMKMLAEECRVRNDRRFRVWGVTLSAGDNSRIIAGELGYSIGKTYTSLTGFFHRNDRRYSNFGKLQMIMLAKHLEEAGIKFWNLGQPYMAYKLRLGADVVPRGLFLKRWDKAVKGRTPNLRLN